ncbi:hypothetical protein J6590_005613 [Homalodisca vitripennis]|nr:hypothetical protein J6590_005613 [Homalodisca vitripennis]
MNQAVWYVLAQLGQQSVARSPTVCRMHQCGVPHCLPSHNNPDLVKPSNMISLNHPIVTALPANCHQSLLMKTFGTELNHADVHVGRFSLDNGPDIVIASPEPLYLDYDSDIIPATPKPYSRVIVPTSRIPQQAHVPSERIPS